MCPSIKSKLHKCTVLWCTRFLGLLLNLSHPCLSRAHWYLVVICFPGLDDPKSDAGTDSDSPSHNGTSESQVPEETQGTTKSSDDKIEPPVLKLNDKPDEETGTT